MAELNTYDGTCHCGAVSFRVEWQIDELTTCDCSLCVARNALMAKVPETALTILGGEDVLVTAGDDRGHGVASLGGGAAGSGGRSLAFAVASAVVTTGETSSSSSSIGARRP